MTVTNVGEAVEEQIFGLTKKQDQLMKKQDKRNKIVIKIANNLMEARLEILTLGNSYLISDNTRNV